jgi:hypothetical protein
MIAAEASNIHTSMSSIDDVMRNMITFVQTTYDGKGEIMPMWTLVDKNGQCYVYLTPFDGEDSKQAVDMMIRQQCAVRDIVMIGFMSEVWTYSAPAGTSEEEARRIPPSERPDRKEAILFIAEHINGEHRSAHMVIERDAEGTGILQPYTERDNHTKMTGRFVNFFHRKPADQAVH